MVGALHAEIKEKGTSNQGFWLKSRFLAKIKENGQLSRFLAKPDEEGPEESHKRVSHGSNLNVGDLGTIYKNEQGNAAHVEVIFQLGVSK